MPDQHQEDPVTEHDPTALHEPDEIDRLDLEALVGEPVDDVDLSDLVISDGDPEPGEHDEDGGPA